MTLEFRRKVYTIIFYAIELIFFPIYMWFFICYPIENFGIGKLIITFMLFHSMIRMLENDPVYRLISIWEKISKKSVSFLGDMIVLGIWILVIILKIALLKILF